MSKMANGDELIIAVNRRMHRILLAMSGRDESYRSRNVSDMQIYQEVTEELLALHKELDVFQNRLLQRLVEAQSQKQVSEVVVTSHDGAASRNGPQA